MEIIIVISHTVAFLIQMINNTSKESLQCNRSVLYNNCIVV